jgi:hypothetical protein
MLARCRAPRHHGDDDAVVAGWAQHLAAAQAGFALHVLAAVDTDEFEVCFHSLLYFAFCRVMRDSVAESIKESLAERWLLASSHLSVQASSFAAGFEIRSAQPAATKSYQILQVSGALSEAGAEQS